MLFNLNYAEVLKELKKKALDRAGLEEDEVLGLIEERVTARKNKDFKMSDQIRTDLTAKGIALMDVGAETVWRPCVPSGQDQETSEVNGEQKMPPFEQQKLKPGIELMVSKP